MPIPGRAGGHRWPCRIMVMPTSSPGSVAVEGPLPTGMIVTVLPGRSSRSLRGSSTGVGRASGAGAGAATTVCFASTAANGLESFLGRREAGIARVVARGCTARDVGGCCTSSGEANSRLGAAARRVRSRSGRDATSFGCSGPHPRTAAIIRVSGSGDAVRMDSSGCTKSTPKLFREAFPSTSFRAFVAI